MRIITGSARGRRLESPPGDEITRPTAERVKEAVFSILQFDIEGRSVLDLFAGSGQMGIEALSRGAVRAVFVDRDPKCAKIIEQNVMSTGFAEKARVVKMDYVTFLEKEIHTNSGGYGLVFLDPPYLSDMLIPSAQRCVELLALGGHMVCEHPAAVELPKAFGSAVQAVSRRYGTTKITIYRRG